MSNTTRRFMMGAAGAGEKTYVEDVYSTFLYNGNGASQTIENGLKLGNSNAGGSVKFQEGSLDKLSFASTSDFTFGTGDFTIECFVNYTAISNDGIFSLSSTAGGITTGAALSLNVLSQDSGKYSVYFKNTQNITSAPGTCSNVAVNTGQWYHLAMVRNSGQSRFFVNGVAQTFGSDCTNDITIADTTNYTWTNLGLGGYYDNTFLLNGRISNFRITKGQALYWSNFTSSTAALTTTSQGATASNVKLLCCNKGTVTGKTVGPTITSSGSPIASVFGPFTGSGGEGGLVWVKRRDNSGYSILTDTVNGASKYLVSNEPDALSAGGSQLINAVNSNGFNVGNENAVNNSSGTYSSWSFRESKGFFDVVTYTGNATTRTISHSLGSVPGLILIKDLTTAHDWVVYHRSMGNESFGKLNTNNSFWTGNDIWNSTSPTSSNFTIKGNNSFTNTNSNNYIAYVFAGGESTAATARSVDFDGNDSLTLAASNDFYCTGDLTIEGWFNPDTNNERLFGLGNRNGSYGISVYMNGSQLKMEHSGILRMTISAYPIPIGQWTHVALVRNGSTVRLYIDGISRATYGETWTFGSATNKAFCVGGGLQSDTPYDQFDGKISNFRMVNGTAVYTSDFTPSTAPLTSITNTKLLCCNNSSTTGSTVTPGTITANGDPTASTYNPFDDPEGFKFGEEGDQNIVKTGSYTGNHTTKPEINLGFEPQWLLLRNTNLSTEQWFIFDSMRGIISDGTDYVLEPSRDVAESGWDLIDLTSTGFKIKMNDDKVNNNGGNYIYMAIRRPDPLVAKPVEDATKVFAMDNGSQNALPGYVSGFPVDFYFYRDPTTSSGWMSNWSTYARLMARKYLRTNTSESQVTDNAATFNFMNGAQDYNNFGTNFVAWMWKRYSGFDVVTYTGKNPSSDPQSIQHSLARIPEMMWVKKRSNTGGWNVYHKGLNGGTNPEQYSMQLNSSNAEGQYVNDFNSTAPTATHFTVGPGNSTNQNDVTYIAMLFASVAGISKVGYYAGSGSTRTITTGFQPRFLIVKVIDNTLPWYVLDTTRGWGSGNDSYLQLNETSGQVTNFDFGAPTATGFTMQGGAAANNESGLNYIYYAHA